MELVQGIAGRGLLGPSSPVFRLEQEEQRRLEEILRKGKMYRLFFVESKNFEKNIYMYIYIDLKFISYQIKEKIYRGESGRGRN